MRTRLFLLTSDCIFISASFFLSFQWFYLKPNRLWKFYALFLTIKLCLFILLGLYRAILRFSGLPLAVTILKTTCIASLLCFAIIALLDSQPIPNGFFVTDYLLTTFFVGLVRFAPRYILELWKEKGSKRILIYGAGVLGEEVARKLLRDPGEYHLVGFIDDNSSKVHQRLHNLPIYGPTSLLSQILTKHGISELIIAISLLDGEEIRKITSECRKNGVYCRIVPTFTDMLKREIDIKNIDISDLLKREPKDLDEQQIRRFIRDKTILVTGAGGSIGSELSRQCIRYGAKRLILVDHSEFNLYSLQEELSRGKDLSLRFCLTNILNGNLEAVFREEKPSILFHTAAYKHVPIVESNAFEGVINNVQGTIKTAQLAEKYGVEKYVLISTDKAVRPTSVMGASKRIAELFIQNLNTNGKTEYISVRFGNVLGSSGSVIPKFIEQINRGGPITVTHQEVTRYFMLTNEAVKLVLQAASIGNGGEIFILNMGKPVKISEMAEDLIFLSGRKPHEDIRIEYSGLRPGEKLYEELLIDDTEKKTQYENITIGRATYVNWNWLTSKIDMILKHAGQNNLGEMLKAIKVLVPEFNHTRLETKPDFPEMKVFPMRSTN